MEIGKDFSTWFKDRVSQYDFTENVDFVLLPNSGEYSGRGQPPKEYAISLDMAKELAMVERNEKGKQVRRYFIECERRAQTRSEEHTSELQSLMRISYAVFCLKKKTKQHTETVAQ